MKISEMSDESIERAKELLEEYIFVLSDIFIRNKDSLNFDEKLLQKEFDNYIVNIDEKTQLDKKKIAIVVFQLGMINLYRGDLLEKIQYYCYDLVDYKFKLENYLMCGIEDEDIKSDESNENIESFYEKYGKDLVDSAEKKIKEYPSYLVPGNVFSKEELPYISEKFSEGNSQYAEVLYNLNFNGIYTFSGCIGHDDFDFPYISFKIPKDNPEFFNKFLHEYNKEFKEKGHITICHTIPLSNEEVDDIEETTCSLYCDCMENRDEFFSKILSALEFAKSHKDVVYDDQYEKASNLVKKIYGNTNKMILPSIVFKSCFNPVVKMDINSKFSENEIYEEQNKNAFNIYSNMQMWLLDPEKNNIDFLSQKIDDIIQDSKDGDIDIPSIPQLGIEYTNLVEEEDSILNQAGYTLETLADNDERLVELSRLQDEILKRVNFIYLDRMDEFFDFVDDCIKNKDKKEK